jgi:hypothetical protein
MPSDAKNMDAAGADLEDEGHIDSPQQNGVDREESHASIV